MKKIFLHFIGFLLLLPEKTSALGIDDFRQDGVFRPDNLPTPNTGDISAEGRVIEILNFVINLLLYASGSVAVLMLVVGGLRYAASRGNEEGVDGAKKLLRNSFLGLAAVILAYAIVTNVVDLLYRATA